MSKNLDMAVIIVLFILGMTLEFMGGYSIAGGIKFNDTLSTIFGIIIIIIGIVLYMICWEVYLYYSPKSRKVSK